MRVFVVQGIHFSIPGHNTSVYASRESAEKAALWLVNSMLEDLELEAEPVDWRGGMGRVTVELIQREVCDEDDIDAEVWIDEHEVIGG